MADSPDNAVLYAAIYDGVDPAIADLQAFERLHKDEIIGKYDAAVVTHEDGRPHIVRRADHPGIRVIPEWFGAGTLRRGELHEAAEALDPGQAALFVVGEPTLAQGLEKAITRAASTFKRDLNAASDELAKELIHALRS